MLKHISPETEAFIKRDIARTNERQIKELTASQVMDCRGWEQQLIYDLNDKFEETINKDGEIETLTVYTNEAYKAEMKQRWIRDELKRHGRPSTINPLDYVREPWNNEQDIDCSEEDTVRDSLEFDDRRAVTQEPTFNEVQLEQVVVRVPAKDDRKAFTFDAFHIICPEATIQLSTKTDWETIINIMDTLEDLSSAQRLYEIATYEANHIFVTWNIETKDPLFSRAIQTAKDYDRSSAWFEFNNTSN